MHGEAEEGGPAHLERRQLLRAGIAGGAFRYLLGSLPAAADQALDVQILQTAASIENATVSAYDTILGLPLLTATGANPTFKAVLTAARGHHSDHAAAYNDAVGKLGGKTQNGSNPTLAQIVSRERSRLVELGGVVELALQLETVAAQTYQANLAIIEDLNGRKLTASILAVEAQHAAVLLIARALVATRTQDLINLDSGAVGTLPEDAGRVPSAEAFAKVDQARPPSEGALQ